MKTAPTWLMPSVLPEPPNRCLNKKTLPIIEPSRWMSNPTGAYIEWMSGFFQQSDPDRTSNSNVAAGRATSNLMSWIVPGLGAFVQTMGARARKDDAASVSAYAGFVLDAAIFGGIAQKAPGIALKIMRNSKIPTLMDDYFRFVKKFNIEDLDITALSHDTAHIFTNSPPRIRVSEGATAAFEEFFQTFARKNKEVSLNRFEARISAVLENIKEKPKGAIKTAKAIGINTRDFEKLTKEEQAYQIVSRIHELAKDMSELSKKYWSVSYSQLEKFDYHMWDESNVRPFMNLPSLKYYYDLQKLKPYRIPIAPAPGSLIQPTLNEIKTNYPFRSLSTKCH
jgi:hypothetical protein